MNAINTEEENEFDDIFFQTEIPNLDKLVKDGKITSLTAEKAKISKSIIEKKYNKLITRQKNHKKIWVEIDKYFSTITTLTDSEKNDIKLMALEKENQILKLFRKKISINDFEIIKPIGKGGFGEVNICRNKENKKIYAMKRMTFEQLKYKNGLLNFLAEKDILSINNNNVWMTQLRFSFIDNQYLYLIMDYCPGGDLMSYLINRDTLEETEARFYIAEIILCVDSLHKMNCIHRDLKPDNILIGKDGHIKLSDFGLSFISREKLFPFTENKTEKIIPGLFFRKTSAEEDEKNIEIKNSINDSNKSTKSAKSFQNIIAYSGVGSPDYMAPELILNENNKGYGGEIDWWSVGAIFYEMLVGIPPFLSDTPQATCEKIVHYQKYLKIPDQIKISNEAEKLIFGFLTEPKKRLGINGIDEIKKKPFFKNFDWDKIRDMSPPFIPKLDSPEDTRYFLHEKNINGINNLTSNKRITNRIKRTNIYFNRDNIGENNNRISFPKYCFQFDRNVIDIENNMYNELMDLITKEVDYRVKNNITLGDESIDEKSSVESINNLSSNRLSARTYSLEKYLNYSAFSPNTSSKLSYKSVLSAKKKPLNILPIRNLMNLKKNQNKSKNKSKNKNKEDNKKKENAKKGKLLTIHKHKDNI